jgi:hypothetical protein
MRLIIIALLGLTIACSPKEEKASANAMITGEALVSMLEDIFDSEQIPIRQRDSLMRVHGVDSPEAEVVQEIVRKNHAINEEKITKLLDNQGWPPFGVIGEQGNRTICNVLQHSSPEVRIQYLPIMQQAVLDKQLSPQLLVRAEDRIATDQGKLQIYGGQMKWYPETQSFNVWPVYDPVNINKRRAAIGLGTIEEHLMQRFDFEWDLEEQIRRSEEFIKAKNNAEE